MRLIDADTVNGTFAPCEVYTGREVSALLNQQPTAYDVDKVVERLDVNVDHNTDEDIFTCAECGTDLTNKDFTYCPTCGRKLGDIVDWSINDGIDDSEYLEAMIQDYDPCDICDNNKLDTCPYIENDDRKSCPIVKDHLKGAVKDELYKKR